MVSTLGGTRGNISLYPRVGSAPLICSWIAAAAVVPEGELPGASRGGAIPPEEFRAIVPGLKPTPERTSPTPRSAPANSTWFAVVAALLLATPQLAAPSVPASTPARPRIGLVLSGGGARGTAHIGVLKALEKHRIPIDVVAGTSIGAVVGGLYAAGLSPACIDSTFSGMNWAEKLSDAIPRGDRTFRRKRDDDLYFLRLKLGLRGTRLVLPPGLLDGHRVDLLLKRLTLPVVTIRDFDSLGIPYRALATDIVTGEAVTLGHGDLAAAMRASMSVPAAFAPREIDGRLLVDGGMADNIPIEVARRMGAEVIIAVDIGSPPMNREQLSTIPAISTQLSRLLSLRKNAEEVASLGKGDVFIRPELGDMTETSFDHVAEAVAIGEQATEAALGGLERFALTPEAYAGYKAALAARIAPRGPRSRVVTLLINQSPLSDAVVAARVAVPEGDSVTAGPIEGGLNEIYGLELFESVYYDMTAGAGVDTLTVSARERAWGPNYLQAGLSVSDDFSAPNFGFAVAYCRTAVNHLNGEWRSVLEIGQEPGLRTEFYQPLDVQLRQFLDLDLGAGERSLRLFDTRGRELSALGITRFGGALACGRDLGTLGEVRVGVERERGRIRTRIGDPESVDHRYDTGRVFGQTFVDKLDELAFPHHGGSLRARYSASLHALGATKEYQQTTLEVMRAATRGRLSGILGGQLATTGRSDAPLESLFPLGGFGRLSGLHQNELIGQHALLLHGALYQRVVQSTFQSMYAGLTGEFGNVFQSRSAIKPSDGIAAGSVFVGFDTLIGPLCIAYGRTQWGRGSFYLTLGRSLGARP